MYKFEELIDFNDIKSLIQDFGNITDTTMAIVNIEGDILLKSDSSKFCKKNHKNSEKLCVKCITDKHLLVDSVNKSTKCHFGLEILSVPITTHKGIIGYIQMSQYLTKEPDLEYYKKQAQINGFNIEEYVETLKEIPIIPEIKLDSYKSFLAKVSMSITKISYKQLQQEEQGNIIKTSNDLLEREINKRTVELSRTNYMYRESREKYKSLLDFLPHVIYVIVDGKIKFANKATQKFFGVDKITDLIGVDEKEFIEFPLSEKNKMVHLMEKIENGEDIPFVELKVIRKNDNKIVDVDIGISKYTFDNVNGHLVIIKKINYKEEAEEYSRLLNEAISYDKLKTEFFSNISHEFRTPLNVIVSALQVLEMYSKSENMNIYIDKNEKYRLIMRQNCYRLLKLVNNIIDITKIDSGYFEINLKNHNIVSMVESIVFSVKDYIENNDLKLEFTKEVSEIIIACDAEKIERIILNLLSNAVKFTPSGGKISIRITQIDNNICIFVKDTGIGIPIEKQRIIFERFRQVDKSFARSNEGSGIGLALVQSLVQMQNGKIELKSELGKGSEFKVYFPIMKVQSCESNMKNTHLNDNRVEIINIEFSDIYEKN